MSPNEHLDSDESETIMKKRKTSNDDFGGLRTDALQAGKRFAVCNNLWVDPTVVSHLVTLTDSGTDAEPASDEPTELREQAEAIFRSLPTSLRPHVGTRWFRKRVSVSYCLIPWFSLTFFCSLRKVFVVYALIKSTFLPTSAQATSFVRFRPVNSQIESSVPAFLRSKVF